MIRHIVKLATLAWLRRLFGVPPLPEVDADPDVVIVIEEDEAPPVDVPIALRRRRLDRAFVRHGSEAPTVVPPRAASGEIRDLGPSAAAPVIPLRRRRVVVQATDDRATVLVRAVDPTKPGGAPCR